MGGHTEVEEGDRKWGGMMLKARENSRKRYRHYCRWRK